MAIQIGLDEWIYALVEKHPNDEQIIGQYDTEHDIRFIPIYLNRDIAQLGARYLAIHTSYEIQAIIFEDLLRFATQNQSLIFLMDDHGSLLTKFSPDGQTL